MLESLSKWGNVIIFVSLLLSISCHLLCLSCSCDIMCLFWFGFTFLWSIIVNHTQFFLAQLLNPTPPAAINSNLCITHTVFIFKSRPLFENSLIQVTICDLGVRCVLKVWCLLSQLQTTFNYSDRAEVEAKRGQMARKEIEDSIESSINQLAKAYWSENFLKG